MSANAPVAGFIGLGLMGSRMAGRLLDRGFALTVWNRTPAKCEPLVARGARLARSAEALVRDVPIAITMVVDPEALDRVIEQASPALGPGKLWVDMSTVGPLASRRAAERVHARGAAFVDAPVLGSLAPAAAGELMIFAGGAAPDLEGARPVFEALGKRTIPCGPVGSGSALKIVANMMICRMVEALGEAFSLGMRQGLSGEVILDMMQSSALASPMWNRGTTLLAGDPPVHFPLTHAIKDLRLAEEAARAVSAKTPANPAVRGVFEDALKAGLGDADYSMAARRLFA
jgi:3-hydroxyisobutyrate dehydrogenase-like beta-hydroxyacid dehydrogenase